jgi:glycosyltransferase involved in cell wall biosynthesis
MNCSYKGIAPSHLIMKVLHVTFRFGPDIVGGAEHYLMKLSEYLARQGMEVDIVTTTARHLTQKTHFGVRWDKSHGKGIQHVGPLRVFRFPAQNLPWFLFGIGAWALQRQWDGEEWHFPLSERLCPQGQGLLGRGWYYPEIHAEGAMRWTQQRAELFINDFEVSQVHLVARCPKRITGKLMVNGKYVGSFQPRADFKQFSFDVRSSGPVHGEVVLSGSWRPLRDVRRLGISVRDVGYTARGETKHISLETDYRFSLLGEPDSLWDRLYQRATARPEWCGTIFDLLRGPICLGMQRFLRKNARHYDVILGHCFPFSTVGYACREARRAGVPVALFPLAHLDDDYYHWRHYYQLLRRANVVLAISPYAEQIFRDRLGVNAKYVGAGVERTEFESAEVSGARFRQRFQLEHNPFVLFVGRKVMTKRYDLLVKAIELVNRQTPCQLILIGPDEDRTPISSPYVRHLGSLSRADLLDAYDACNVFAMMSESESFGMVFCEARMRKKPVIGNRQCRPVAALIQDDTDGFLCDTVSDLASRILLLVGDPLRAQRMGELGYQKTVQHHSWEAVAERVKNIYQEIARPT